MSFNTDHPGVASCDRNNCRCGDNKNCMYYNSSGPGQAHYNYVAVQGAGDPSSPYYGCMRSAMDLYNAENYYADHAGMVVPGYAAKQVVQNDLDFSTHKHHPAPVAFCSHGVPAMHCGMCGGVSRFVQRPVLGLPLWVWAILVAGWIWAVKAGKVPKMNLADKPTQLILIVFLVVCINPSGGIAINNIGTGVGTAGSGKTGTNEPDTIDFTLPSVVKQEPLREVDLSHSFGALSSNVDLSGSVFDGPPEARPIGDPNKRLQKQTSNSDLDLFGQFYVGRVQSGGSHRQFMNGGAPGALVTAWENRSASDYLPILSVRFGYPSAIDPTPGGLAVWKSEKLANTCLTRIELRDEAVPHLLDGTRHFDFVYVYVDFPAKSIDALGVLQLSGTLGYDRIKQQLWARCNTTEGAIATLALATQIGAAISLNYAQANDLLYQYLVASGDPYQTSRIYDLLCYNLNGHV